MIELNQKKAPTIRDAMFLSVWWGEGDLEISVIVVLGWEMTFRCAEQLMRGDQTCQHRTFDTENCAYGQAMMMLVMPFDLKTIMESTGDMFIPFSRSTYS